MSNALAIDPVRRPVFDPQPAPEPAPDLSPRPAQAPDGSTRPAQAPVFRIRRARLAAAGALVGGIGCVLVAQLLLSIQSADDAFTLQRLQAAQTQAAREVQVRTERLEVLSAPQHLAARATALGMVPSGAPSVLRLSDGRVLKATGAGPLASGTALVPVADGLLGR